MDRDGEGSSNMRSACRWSLCLLAIVAAACGTENTGPSGVVTIRITDTPFADARAVLVTFSEVSIHRSGSGWERVPFQPESGARTCDLKKLVGAQDVLGTGPLPEGHYTQIRLNIVGARLFWDNAAAGPACGAAIAPPLGRSSEITIPSGEVKLNREFDVRTAGALTITLDFDGDRSIRETGNGRYMMAPVVTVVSVR
jgi:hypothetical protein